MDRLDEALAIAREALGEHAPEVAGTLYNLAMMRARQGNVVEAEQMYRELHEVELAIFGPDHPYPLVGRYQVARMLVRQGRHAKAVGELEAVLADQRRILSPGTRDLLRTLTALGASLVETGRHADAVPRLREALAGMEALEDEPMIEQTEAREFLSRAEAGADE